MKMSVKNAIDNCIRAIFRIIMVVAALLFAVVVGAGFYYCGLGAFGYGVEHLLKGIEYVFIAPLPFFIIGAFYKMYKVVTRPLILAEQHSLDFERDQIMVDLTLTKFMFISTVLSTLMVIIIEMIYRMIDDEKAANIEYKVIGLAVVMVVILIYYVNLIDKHLGHKIRDAKDSMQKRFVDQTYKQAKLDELDKEDIDEENEIKPRSHPPVNDDHPTPKDDEPAGVE